MVLILNFVNIIHFNDLRVNLSNMGLIEHTRNFFLNLVKTLRELFDPDLSLFNLIQHFF